MVNTINTEIQVNEINIIYLNKYDIRQILLNREEMKAIMIFLLSQYILLELHMIILPTAFLIPRIKWYWLSKEIGVLPCVLQSIVVPKHLSRLPYYCYLLSAKVQCNSKSQLYFILIVFTDTQCMGRQEPLIDSFYFSTQ